MPNLKEITGNANFKGSQITTLPALEKVGSDFIINSSRIDSCTDINECGQPSYSTSTIQLRENYDVKGDVMDIIMSHIDKDTENRMSYLL